ncbi:MAG TPA: prohibitin family protein [Terriglobia bacterium]|nr:prohibitin family protein [Terriglobia bacterium]
MAGGFTTVTYTPGGFNRKLALRIIAIVAILIIALWLTPFGTIAAGERGVHLRFQAVAGVKKEGLYFIVPLIDTVQRMDIKIQKEQVEADAASKDLQTVDIVVALNYHVNADRVADIYERVGLGYKERIIDPALQEAVKASAAKFTAEELITKRELVREDIKTQLRQRLMEQDINVDEFNIVNFKFSKVFNEAIENKVTAEQQALAARNKLEQIKFEAEQKVAEAKGKAEAITIESNALRSNPQILELRALEKWNGALPQVTGSGGVPFINLNK